jgi:hypothetical protein
MWVLVFLMLQGDAVITKRLGTFEAEEQCVFKQYEFMPYLEKGEALECWRVSE